MAGVSKVQKWLLGLVCVIVHVANGNISRGKFPDGINAPTPDMGSLLSDIATQDPATTIKLTNMTHHNKIPLSADTNKNVFDWNVIGN